MIFCPACSYCWCKKARQKKGLNATTVKKMFPLIWFIQFGLIVRDFHHNLWFQHSWQTIANPPILWRLPILLSPVFQILPNPLPHYFCCLVSLTKCVITPHLTCYFALWYYGPKLGTLVQATPCFVLYTIRHQIYCRFDTDDMSFASTLIW